MFGVEMINKIFFNPKYQFGIGTTQGKAFLQTIPDLEREERFIGYKILFIRNMLTQDEKRRILKAIEEMRTPSQFLRHKKKGKEFHNPRSLEVLSRERLGIYANISFFDIFSSGLDSIDEIIVSYFERSTLIKEPYSCEVIGYSFDSYIFTSSGKKFKFNDDYYFDYLVSLKKRDFKGYRILGKAKEIDKNEEKEKKREKEIFRKFLKKLKGKNKEDNSKIITYLN